MFSSEEYKTAIAVMRAHSCEELTEGFVDFQRQAERREADSAVLQPLRELHEPITEPIWWHKTMPSDPDEYTHCRCQAGFGRWPCETAKLIYTTEELP